MRQPTCTAPGAVGWLDVPEPAITAALVADGTLRPGRVTTEVVDWVDADEHVTDPTIKLVFHRTGA